MGDHRLAHGAPIASGSAGEQAIGRRPGSGGGRSSKRAATRSEKANSSPSRPPAAGKPIENVCRPRWPCLGEQRDDQARVQAAGEQDARRARRPPCGGAPRRAAPRAPRPCQSAGVQAARAGSRAKGGSQYTPLAAPAVGLDDQHRRGRQLAHAAQDRPRRGHDRVPAEVVVQRHAGRRACRRRRRAAARGAWRRSAARRRAVGQVQRLDAEPVAREHERGRCRARRGRRRTSP